MLSSIGGIHPILILILKVKSLSSSQSSSDHLERQALASTWKWSLFHFPYFALIITIAQSHTVWKSLCSHPNPHITSQDADPLRRLQLHRHPWEARRNLCDPAEPVTSIPDKLKFVIANGCAPTMQKCLEISINTIMEVRRSSWRSSKKKNRRGMEKSSTLDLFFLLVITSTRLGSKKLVIICGSLYFFPSHQHSSSSSSSSSPS